MSDSATTKYLIPGNPASIITASIFILTLAFSSGMLWMNVQSLSTNLAKLEKKVDLLNDQLIRLKLVSVVENKETAVLWGPSG